MTPLSKIGVFQLMYDVRKKIDGAVKVCEADPEHLVRWDINSKRYT